MSHGKLGAGVALGSFTDPGGERDRLKTRFNFNNNQYVIFELIFWANTKQGIIKDYLFRYLKFRFRYMPNYIINFNLYSLIVFENG